MPRFRDLAAALSASDPFPEDGWDQLGAAYDDDMNELTTGSEAKIGQLSTDLENLTAEQNQLKAHNYELLMAAATPPADARTPEEGDDSTDGNDADELDAPADEFFTEDEDDEGTK